MLNAVFVCKAYLAGAAFYRIAMPIEYPTFFHGPNINRLWIIAMLKDNNRAETCWTFICYTVKVALFLVGPVVLGCGEPEDAAQETTSVETDTNESEASSASDMADTSSETDTEMVVDRCEQLGERIQALAQAHQQKYSLVGLSLSFATLGCEAKSWSWGIADYHSEEPLRTEHLMRIGSVTKSYTAALMLKLVEEGKVNLGDTLADWGWSFAASAEITIQQLLNHTSGLRSYEKNADFIKAHEEDPAREWTAQELAEYSIELEPVDEPGARHVYANGNYILASLVIEKASGQSYGEALRSRIFQPAGLVHTYLEAAETWSDPFALGHVAQGGSVIGDVTDLDHASQVGTAGAIVSTAGDLRSWMATLLTSDFLTETSQKALQQWVPGVNGYDYGLGVLSLEWDEESSSCGHDGAAGGFRSSVFHHPKTESTIAIMQNQFSFSKAGHLLNDSPTMLVAEVLQEIESGF